MIEGATFIDLLCEPRGLFRGPKRVFDRFWMDFVWVGGLTSPTWRLWAGLKRFSRPAFGWAKSDAWRTSGGGGVQRSQPTRPLSNLPQGKGGITQVLSEPMVAATWQMCPVKNGSNILFYRLGKWSMASSGVPGTGGREAAKRSLAVVYLSKKSGLQQSPYTRGV